MSRRKAHTQSSIRTYYGRSTRKIHASRRRHRRKGLRKSFKKLTVLDGIDLSVKRGTVLTLLGPNGAGKTTRLDVCVSACQHCRQQSRLKSLARRNSQ